MTKAKQTLVRVQEIRPKVAQNYLVSLWSCIVGTSVPPKWFWGSRLLFDSSFYRWTAARHQSVSSQSQTLKHRGLTGVTSDGSIYITWRSICGMNLDLKNVQEWSLTERVNIFFRTWSPKVSDDTVPFFHRTSNTLHMGHHFWNERWQWSQIELKTFKKNETKTVMHSIFFFLTLSLLSLYVMAQWMSSLLD